MKQMNQRVGEGVFSLGSYELAAGKEAKSHHRHRWRRRPCGRRWHTVTEEIDESSAPLPPRSWARALAPMLVAADPNLPRRISLTAC